MVTLDFFSNGNTCQGWTGHRFEVTRAPGGAAWIGIFRPAWGGLGVPTAHSDLRVVETVRCPLGLR